MLTEIYRNTAIDIVDKNRRCCFSASWVRTAPHNLATGPQSIIWMICLMHTRSGLSAAESLQRCVYPPYKIFLFLPKLGNCIALYCTTKQTHSSYKATTEKCKLFLIVARTRTKLILAKTSHTLQETSLQNFWVSAITKTDGRHPLFCVYRSAG